MAGAAVCILGGYLFNKEINSYDYSYEFDKKLHPPYNNVHNLIKESISLIETNDIVTFQVVLPYYFLTDTKDLSITLLDPNLETDNLEFLSGSFNIYKPTSCKGCNLEVIFFSPLVLKKEIASSTVMCKIS